MVLFNVTALAISLSDSKPKARTKVINGISTGDPGIFPTTEPSGRIINSSFALYPTIEEYTLAL